MKSNTPKLCYYLNYLSVFLLSIAFIGGLIAVLLQPHLLNITFIQEPTNKSIYVIYYKPFKKLKNQERILYITENQFYIEHVKSINPPKYQIYLTSGNYTLPSHYIGVLLTTLNLPFSLSIFKLLFIIGSFLPILLLAYLVHHQRQYSKT